MSEILPQLGMYLVNMGLQLAFYALVAYLVMKYGRKGWKAGE